MAIETGKLEIVDLREIWAHEAHDFTPWLADNLDILSTAIGIASPLEILDTEAQVGRFAADILALNPLDNSGVLIENQLEPSDHTHLGQMMTYLAGRDVQTIIWVAGDFWEEHLSATHWLNQNTPGQFNFFAVKVMVVELEGDITSHVVLDVMESPDEWWTDERLVISQDMRDAAQSVNDFLEEQYARLQEIQVRKREESRVDGLSAQGLFFREFWTYYAECYPDDGVSRGFSGRNPDYPIEHTRLKIRRAIMQGMVGVWVAKLNRKSLESIEVLLEPYLPSLAELLNMEPEEILSQYYTAWFGVGIDPHDRGNWDEAVDTLHELLMIYRDILE